MPTSNPPIAKFFSDQLAEIWKFIQAQPVEMPTTAASIDLAPTLERWRQVELEIERGYNPVYFRTSDLAYHKKINKSFPKLNLYDRMQSIRSIAPSLFGYQFFRFLDLWLSADYDFDHRLDCIKKEYNWLSELQTSGSIVFSSDPWDLLTMSMRGINSCMEWFSTNSTSLKGSILDPGCAMIYLTDGKASRSIQSFRGQVPCLGPRMLIRSIVRLIQVGKKKEPGLLLEQFYFHPDLKFHTEGLILDWIYTLFSRYIKQFTTLPVYLSPPVDSSIPNFSGLNDLTRRERSYRDSKIKYEDELED